MCGLAPTGFKRFVITSYGVDARINEEWCLTLHHVFWSHHARRKGLLQTCLPHNAGGQYRKPAEAGPQRAAGGPLRQVAWHAKDEDRTASASAFARRAQANEVAPGMGDGPMRWRCGSDIGRHRLHMAEAVADQDDFRTVW